MPDSDVSFFVDRGTRSQRMIETFLKTMSEQEPDWRIGAKLRLPRASAAYQNRLAAALEPHAAYVIADPETRLMHLPAGKRGKGRRDYSYLAESDPIANRNRFTDQVLNAQILNGRDVLISPWLVHSLSGTPRELQATTAFAEIADESGRRGDRRLLLGFEATENIIGSTIPRNKLLNEIVETPEHAVYLRMTVGAATGAIQYKNEGALKGLRKVAEAMAANSRVLLLPQSGLVGWLMLGFGTLGFGSGVQFSCQRPETPRVSGGGGGAAPPLHWYFWPPFLGFVQAEEAPLLAASGNFEHCSCPFCQNALPPVGGAFDSQAREAAEKHFLWWCASLCQEARAATDRKQAIRDRLDAAESYWAAAQAAGVQLDARSRPEHLAVWSQVAA